LAEIILIWRFITTPTFLRGGEYPERLAKIKEMTDVIIIDEGHHFRNPGVNIKLITGNWRISAKGNNYFAHCHAHYNSLRDLQHMIELFTVVRLIILKQAPLRHLFPIRAF